VAGIDFGPGSSPLAMAVVTNNDTVTAIGNFTRLPFFSLADPPVFGGGGGGGGGSGSAGLHSTGPTPWIAAATAILGIVLNL
jgi:hypothetical protein